MKSGAILEIWVHLCHSILTFILCYRILLSKKWEKPVSSILNSSPYHFLNEGEAFTLGTNDRLLSAEAAVVVTTCQRCRWFPRPRWFPHSLLRSKLTALWASNKPVPIFRQNRRGTNSQADGTERNVITWEKLHRSQQQHRVHIPNSHSENLSNYTQLCLKRLNFKIF